jgi:hypothetical protein
MPTSQNASAVTAINCSKSSAVCHVYIFTSNCHYVVVRTFPVLAELAGGARNLRPGCRGRTDPGMPFPEPETALASTIVESVEVRVT